MYEYLIPFIAEINNIQLTNICFPIHSVDGHVGSFHHLVIVNSAIMNVCVPVFNSWVYTPGSRIAGLCGSSV